MTQPSTDHAQAELQAASEHFLSKPDKAPATNGEAQTTAEERLRRNLTDSATSSFQTSNNPSPGALDPNEDPATMARRHNEKNFSELFGTSMEPMGQRKWGNVDATTTTSWLDGRAEHLHSSDKHQQIDPPQEMRQKELASKVLNEDASGKPVSVAQRTADQATEDIIWQTSSLMDASAEIARRTMTREYERDVSAGQRKMEEQHTSASMAAPMADQNVNFSPRVPNGVYVPAAVDRPASAQQRKQHNLSSAGLW